MLIGRIGIIYVGSTRTLPYLTLPYLTYPSYPFFHALSPFSIFHFPFSARLIFFIKYIIIKYFYFSL